MRAGSLDTLELEVRRIPGVLAVSFDENENTLTVLAPFPAVPEELKRRVAILARAHVSDDLNIEVDSNAPPQVLDEPVVETVDAEVLEGTTATGSGFGSRDKRVQLASVNVAEDGRVTIQLRMGDRESNSSGSSNNLTSVSEAVLVALDQLSMPAPFDVRSVTPIGGAARQVIVVLLRGTASTDERYGAAAGDTPAEATARATLDALNRYLSDNYSRD